MTSAKWRISKSNTAARHISGRTKTASFFSGNGRIKYYWRCRRMLWSTLAGWRPRGRPQIYWCSQRTTRDASWSVRGGEEDRVGWRKTPGCGHTWREQWKGKEEDWKKELNVVLLWQKKGFQGNGCHISRRLWRSLALSSKYARAVKSFLDLQDDSSSLVQS